MSRHSVSVRLCPRKLEAKISTLRDGEPISQVVYDASGLESVIQMLASHRQQMAEPVPETLEPGARIHGTLHPQWRITKNNETTQLIICHPGFGWIAFVLSKEQARMIAGELSD